MSPHALSVAVVPLLESVKNRGKSMNGIKLRAWSATKPKRQQGQDRSEDRGGPPFGKNCGKTGEKMTVLQIRLWENRIICT